MTTALAMKDSMGIKKRFKRITKAFHFFRTDYVCKIESQKRPLPRVGAMMCVGLCVDDDPHTYAPALGCDGDAAARVAAQHAHVYRH